MIRTIERVLSDVSTQDPGLSFALRLPDGIERQFGEGEPLFSLTLHDEEALHDLLFRGTMGFGEAYMRGALDVQGDFQSLLSLNYRPPVRQLHLGARDKARVLKAYAKNSMRRSRENVIHHYDLGNDFYRLWLDESMTYSCGYWGEGVETLEQAQNAKHEMACRKLGLRPGESLIDVGCGWGAMLAYAAQHYGVQGVGYTLSDQQHEYANERFRRLGLYPQVRTVLADYREAEGEFDKFVSIGMFEHVGVEFYQDFFAKTAELLRPGGTGLLHTIGRDRPAEVDAWVTRYIFPGGYLPTVAQLSEPMGRLGLCLTDLENLRLHYALTLDEWAIRFERNLAAVRASFDDTFVRMWRLYLHGSAAAFRWGMNRVFQLTFTNGLRNDLPLTRAYLYLEPPV